MRLTCPNCKAQYEVDDSVIPDGGRDVQCSNCGHSWFQAGKAALAAEEPSEDVLPEPAEWEGEPAGHVAPHDAAAPDAATPPEPQPDAESPAAAPPPLPAASDEKGEDIEGMLSAMVSASREETTAEAGQDAEAPPAAAAAPRRTQDDNLLSILREEAARETQARRAEGSALETQPDLGLGGAAAGLAGAAAAQAAKPAQNRVVENLSADEFEDDEFDDEIPEQTLHRRALPDIEEINSTLSATSDRGGEAAAWDAPQTLARRRSGFRMGFMLIVLLGVIGLLVYSMAPRISEAVPALAPTIDAYVQKVDEGRVWLDQQMRDVIDALQDDSQV
ncbi:MAG: zinc-ribbon domain-containing protein [Paracoccaceae bacterium]